MRICAVGYRVTVVQQGIDIVFTDVAKCCTERDEIGTTGRRTCRLFDA